MTIGNFKQKMTAKAKAKGGIWENFGQKELRKLKDKVINISDYTDEMNAKRNQIKELNNWASNFNINDL